MNSSMLLHDNPGPGTDWIDHQAHFCHWLETNDSGRFLIDNDFCIFAVGTLKSKFALLAEHHLGTQ